MASQRRLTTVKWVLRALVVVAGVLVVLRSLESQTLGGRAWIAAGLLATLGLVSAIAPRWAASKAVVALGVLLLGGTLALQGWFASAPARWMRHELGADLRVAQVGVQEWSFSPDGDAGYQATIFFAGRRDPADPGQCFLASGAAVPCPGPSDFNARWVLVRGSDTLVTGEIDTLDPPSRARVVSFHAWAGTEHRLRVSTRTPDPTLEAWVPQMIVSLDEDSVLVLEAALAEQNLALFAMLHAALTLALLGAARAYGETHRRIGGRERIHTSAIRMRPRWENEADEDEPPGRDPQEPRPRRSVPQTEAN